MLILSLVLGGILALLVAATILVVQKYRISKGLIEVHENYNGPAEVSLTIHAIIRYFLKRSVYLRKFFMQYMLHAMLRAMYYVDIWTAVLYSKSRNWFVQNAVKNRGTVPHFWHHLKVYKQEMDQEKENEGGIR